MTHDICLILIVAFAAWGAISLQRIADSFDNGFDTRINWHDLVHILKRLRPVAAMTAFAMAAIAIADGYVRPDYPPTAHQLTPEQIDRVVDAAPAGASVTVPATYAKQIAERRRVGTNVLARTALEYLGPVIADSRENIPELAGLSDAEVALLYLLQMRKSADDLKAIAPSNTLEYLIGAGMRQDLSGAGGGGD